MEALGPGARDVFAVDWPVTRVAAVGTSPVEQGRFCFLCGQAPARLSHTVLHLGCRRGDVADIAGPCRGNCAGTGRRGIPWLKGSAAGSRERRIRMRF